MRIVLRHVKYRRATDRVSQVKLGEYFWVALLNGEPAYKHRTRSGLVELLSLFTAEG